MHCITLLELTFGFVMEAHTVNEDSGDTIVNFGKVNNQMTELNLTVMVDFDILSNIIPGNVKIYTSSFNVGYCLTDFNVILLWNIVV